MEVIRIVPQGYCKGVVNALRIVKETRELYPTLEIHILGMIIHNKYVIEALDKLNIITHDSPNKSRLELLEEITSGVVIFSAHGVSDEIIAKAYAKGLIVVDASCIDVLNTKQLIKDYLVQDYDIIYIGKYQHPEAEAMLALDTKHIHFVGSVDDAAKLNITNTKLMVTTQTTMSIYDVYQIIKILKERYPYIEVMEEICNATRQRQEAVKDLDVELIYVIGDPHSNNSKNLAKVAKENKDTKVLFIESVNDIIEDDLKGINKVAVTSGASTPPYITNQVIEYLKGYPNHPKPTIDMSKIL